MPDFLSLLMGRPQRRAVETVIPERTFADVILPPATRRTLDEALAQVRNHTLIFNRWGLGERHASGLGLAFNFAGPPGTGKTICAEAIAHALGMKLLVVNYAEIESMWVGETPKNIVEVADLLLRSGAEVDAEADVYGGGCTTLGLAATSVHPEVAGVQEPLLQILLDHGATIDRPNLAGNTHSIVIACFANGRPRAAEFLVTRGAQLDLQGAAIDCQHRRVQ